MQNREIKSHPTLTPSITWPTFFEHLAPPALTVFLTLTIMPVTTLFVFDNDEGINLIKAVLANDGYRLYAQIWNDQPPLFTAALQLAFTLWGQSIGVARGVTVGSTALLVWAFYGVLRLHLSRPAAWFGVLVLLASDNFLRLSASVMIGLPALSLGMVAIYAFLHAQRAQSRFWLIISGVLLAAAMQTKLLTAIIGPLLFLQAFDFGIGRRGQEYDGRGRWRVVVIWAAAVVFAYLAIGIYFGALNFEQLLGTHFTESVLARDAYQGLSSREQLLRYVLFDYGHALLALVGIVVIILGSYAHGLLPLAWLAMVTPLMLTHRPLWYHHYPLLAIVLAWLAAYACEPLWRWAQAQPAALNSRWRRPLALGLAAVVMLAVIFVRAQRTIPEYNQRPYQAEVLQLLQAKAPTTQWVFTDMALYPFYAGLRVPPEIAVFSRKRLISGDLTPSVMVEILQRYRPEQVLLTRFKDDLLADAGFADYLATHYTKVYDNPDVAYYLLER